MLALVRPTAIVTLGVYSWSGLFGLLSLFSQNPSHLVAAQTLLGLAILLSMALALAVLYQPE
jgi:heme A synthase